MELREYDRYTLRQMVLPVGYREKLEHVKRRIRMLTGRNVSTETVIMCLIDEFVSMHGITEMQKSEVLNEKNMKEVGNE